MVAAMITLALTYYESPAMLAKHLEAFAAYPPGFRVVVVDDGSEEAPANMRDCPIPFELWRMRENRPWHQDAARNVAMLRADGVTLLTDIDHVLAPADAEAMAACDWPEGTAYRPLRRWPGGGDTGKRHPNSFVMNPADFWAAGGYDERNCGHYGTDGGFRRQLERARVALRSTDVFALTLYEGIIDDATADLPRKGTVYHAREHLGVRRRLTAGAIPGNEQRFLFPYDLVDSSENINGALATL